MIVFCLVAAGAVASEQGGGKAACIRPMAEGHYPLLPCGAESTAQADRIISACTSELAKEDSRAAASYNRGRAYLQRLFCGGGRTDFDHALADFDTALRKEPAFRDAFAARGLAYEFMGDHANAILDYRRAYRIGVPPGWLVDRLETIDGAP